METTDITKILEIIITVIIAPFIPLLAMRFKKWIDANISREEQAAIISAARLAVLATEQAGLGGADALDRAIYLAESSLSSQGIKVDFKRLETIIEALVMDEFNRNRAEQA